MLLSIKRKNWKINTIFFSPTAVISNPDGGSKNKFSGPKKQFRPIKSGKGCVNLADFFTPPVTRCDFWPWVTPFSPLSHPWNTQITGTKIFSSSARITGSREWIQRVKEKANKNFWVARLIIRVTASRWRLLHPVAPSSENLDHYFSSLVLYRVLCFAKNQNYPIKWGTPSYLRPVDFKNPPFFFYYFPRALSPTRMTGALPAIIIGNLYRTYYPKKLSKSRRIPSLLL